MRSLYVVIGLFVNFFYQLVHSGWSSSFVAHHLYFTLLPTVNLMTWEIARRLMDFFPHSYRAFCNPADVEAFTEEKKRISSR